MKLVKERINEFRRGENPEEKLGLGNFQKPEVGDKFLWSPIGELKTEYTITTISTT